jgi:hypothetical protein
MGNGSENRLQPISLGVKPEYYVSQIILSGIGIRTVISRSKLQVVPPIEFNLALMEWIFTATIVYPEWQDADNATKYGNPSTIVKYLSRALYFKVRQWITATYHMRQMIYEGEHDSKAAGPLGSAHNHQNHKV